jgi:DNA modification methylase
VKKAEKKNGTNGHAWRSRVVGFTEKPANQFTANAFNFRRHPVPQREAFRGLVSELGFAGAVLENKRTGNLIDGHLRIEEALSVDETMLIPCVQVDLSEAEEKLLLASYDPLSAMAEADKETLDLLLRDVSTGDAAVQEMLSKLAESEGLYFGEEGKAEDEEAVAELVDRAAELQKKWKVKKGNLFGLGAHRLFCGDSTKAEHVARLMGGKRADAVLTDPIYGIGQEGVTIDEPEGFTETIRGAVSCLPLDDGVVVAFQSTRTFPTWLDAVRVEGHKFERMLWMYKAAQCTFPWRGWILKSESILVSTKGKPRWRDVKPYSHDCYYLPEVSGELDESIGWHGSVKPLKVVKDLLQRIAPEGAAVFDGFSGSGTTMVAAEELGLVAYCSDIDPANVAINLERLSLLGLEVKKLDG